MKNFFKLLKYRFNKFFGKTELPATIALGTKKPQKWYGRVNYWANLTESKKDIEACIQCKLDGYMIELAGTADSMGNKQWTDAWVKEIETKYKKLLKMTRAAGLWLFVSVVNDNMGKGKYGDTGPKLEKVLSMAKQLAQIVKKYGNKNVIVQPVAETQTTAGKQFETYCINNLGSFLLVNNGNAGFPSGRGQMAYKAVHPGSISKVCPADALVVSDHGLIIKELTVDGSYDGTCDKKKVAIWYANIKSWQCPVMGYYAFTRKKHDKETIKTIGQLT